MRVSPRPQDPELPKAPAPQLVFDALNAAQAAQVTLEQDGPEAAATSLAEAPVALVAKLCRGAANDVGPLAEGTSFEVLIKHRAAGSDDKKGIGIGVGPRGNLTGAPWDRVWAYAATGYTYQRGSCKSQGKAFKTGDRVTVEYTGRKVSFFHNGAPAGVVSGVSGDVWPVVILARKDDQVTIKLADGEAGLIPVADNIWDPAQHAWATINPLHPLFLEAELRKTLPPVLQTEEFTEDLSEYLLEKHLWGPGLAADAMDREALKLASCMYLQLRSRADSESVIRCNAEARARKLLRMPKLVRQSARGSNIDVDLTVSQRTAWSAQDISRSASGRVEDGGLFLWLATQGGVDEPQDPSELGRIEATSMPSSFKRGTVKDIFNVNMKQNNVSEEGDGAYVQVELKDCALIPTAYKIRTGERSKAGHLKNWKLEASSDGDTWTTLRRHANDGTLGTDWQVATWDIEATQSFVFFRIRMTGPNSKDGLTMSLANVEFYGRVITSVDGTGKVHHAASEESVLDSIFGGTFEIFLLMLREQLRSGAQAFAMLAMDKIRTTLDKLPAGCLNPDSTKRPDGIAEPQLDGLDAFLCDITADADDAIAQLAADCLLLLVRGRGRLRDLCRFVLKTMNFASKMMNCVSKVMNYVLKKGIL